MNARRHTTDSSSWPPDGPIPFALPQLTRYGFWSMASEARTDYAMLMGLLFLLIVGGGPWSLDAWLRAPGPHARLPAVSVSAGPAHAGRGGAPAARLGELAAVFLRLGLTAFGGPAAHIAMMEDEAVVRRQWLTRERFLDLLGITNLLPGPSSSELAIYLGYVRAGWPGLLVGGTCFIVPAAVLVTGHRLDLCALRLAARDRRHALRHQARRGGDHPAGALATRPGGDQGRDLGGRHRRSGAQPCGAVTVGGAAHRGHRCRGGADRERS